jgi:putative Holliday junction resolvase
MFNKDVQDKKNLINETLIGVDYGTTNTGVALGKNGLVMPLYILSGKEPMQVINTLVRLALENKVNKFILGVPLNIEGKETKQSIEVRKFGKLLKGISKKPVEYQNEADTSVEALAETIRRGISQKRRKASDHYSAALILERYFDSFER